MTEDWHTPQEVIDEARNRMAYGIKKGDRVIRIRLPDLYGEGVVTDVDAAPYVLNKNGAPLIAVKCFRFKLRNYADEFHLTRMGS